MGHYSKDSTEYRDNGHYEIDGIEFMSIWTFKRKHNIKPNDSSSNGKEGQELGSKVGDIHTSTPDFGNFDKIFLYSVESLEGFYGV